MSDTGVGKRREHTPAAVTLTSLGLWTPNTKVSSSYTFDASEQTVRILAADFVRALLVVNVTDGQVIYNPSVPAQRGTTVGNLLTLNYNTTSMSDEDELMIFYEAAAETMSADQVFFAKMEGHLESIDRQLKLLNLHAAEAFQTNIDEGDVS